MVAPSPGKIPPICGEATGFGVKNGYILVANLEVANFKELSQHNPRALSHFSRVIAKSKHKLWGEPTPFPSGKPGPPFIENDLVKLKSAPWDIISAYVFLAASR